MASVNGRHYLNTASLGVYARIVHSPQYRDRKAETVAEMLPDLMGPGSEPFDLRFAGPGGAMWAGADVLWVSNNQYELLNLGGHRARGGMDSGLLGVIALVLREPEEIAAWVTSETAGAVKRFWTTPTLSVDSGGTPPTVAGAGGEG
jgi:hypothetical protein